MRSLAVLAVAASLAGPAVAESLRIEVGTPVPGQEGAYENKGTIVIDLFDDTAHLAAARLERLAKDGAYDGVAFHRVIDGFMAQTGDVEQGRVGPDGTVGRMAGTGASVYPDLPAEFTDERSFTRGTVGMARSQDPNSANAQFFIMFAPATHLDGQYTVVGEVTEGMDVVDAITLGAGGNGEVTGVADVMTSVTVIED